MYVWADSGAHLAQYRFTGGAFNTTPFAQGATVGGSGSPGGILSVSANGTNAGSGILWAVVNTSADANQAVVPGTLHAYNAQNVGSELWNSDLVARDSLGNLAKFVPPTVANGKVYMATFSGKVNVYGLKASTSPAQLSLSPSSLSFGAVITGQTNTQSFQVVNTGGLTLTGTVAATAPFRISGGSPFSLTTSQTGLVQVAFSPGSAVNFSNVVTFTSNGSNSTNAVTGTGVAPAQLRVSPSSLGFGTLLVGANAQLSFTLTNAGGVALSNGLATVSGGPFSILSGTPFTLPAFGATNLAIRFAPTNAGSFSNVVVITSSGGNSTNALIGTGAALPVADFTGSPIIGTWPLAVLFTDSSTGTITNRSWDFGDNTSTNTTVTSFTHSYAGVGTNTVSLTVIGPVGTNTLTRGGYIVVTNLGPVTLVIQLSGNQLQLTWPAGTLQSALVVTGPYTGVTNASSPFMISPSNSTQFFRIRVR
jgi:PKD repeat protein